ncbi:sugar phosphate isomerase/epimerase family protein [Eudoraea adriatica]|uniref:sugar phosphate isomerase/epimerase family protein n=1 Tax=Eudoraea adriatica TaxID=446681 RepID=UPI000366165A|nr:sugar phosphate isomerase/epimerase family protein [Eudoraea adriatica]
MKRRNFIRNSAGAGIGFSLLGIYSCRDAKKDVKKEEAVEENVLKTATPFFKLSLAQWSIHNMINSDGVDPYTFAEKAKNWGFEGLEYVSQLYDKELEAANYSKEAMQSFVDKCNAEAEKHGLKNLLIMIDGQGDLATSDPAERKKAVENHYKWVDAAASMGCHAIRVNLAGSSDPVEWKANSIDGLSMLSAYAKTKNINILVENHGGLSSNAAMLSEVMTSVNMPNCGTLPDFGNFCIKRKDPKDYAAGCAENYDIYQGVEELMVHAKAVSAKSHNFDANGNETVIDYVRMLQIVKDAGYTGYIGVEYEGRELSEEEGIIATRDLLLRASKEIT